MSDQELLILLEQSRNNNSSKGISGLLLYIDDSMTGAFAGRFIQVLEGSQADVHFIFRLIKRDERHFNVVVLSEGCQTKRYFPNWAMGFRNLRNVQDSTYIDMDKIFCNSEKNQEKNPMLNFMRSFYEIAR